MKKLFIIALASSTFACSTQTYNINENADSTPSKEVSQTFFVDGIGQEKTINAAKICGGADKVAKVESKQTLSNGVLSVVSLGIYTPRQAKVYCTK